MNCNYDKEQFFLLFSDQTDEYKRLELEAHLASCPDCRMEWDAAKKVWDLMGESDAPEPSDSLRTGFTAILRNYKEEVLARKQPWEQLMDKMRDLWSYQPRLQFAYSLLLLVLGLFLGYVLSRPGHPEQQPALAVTGGQIDSLSAQVREMKQEMALSLLENPSASERIRAVSYTNEIGTANGRMIDALLTTLNSDANVNVRLMTLEALVKFAGEPAVREGLVQSITQQESPLVQSAIADVMVKLQEKRSVRSLQQLLHKKDLNEMIRIKIEQSIHKLT